MSSPYGIDVVRLTFTPGPDANYQITVASTDRDSGSHDFTWKPKDAKRMPLVELARATPNDVGFYDEMDDALRTRMRNASCVEIMLPPDPVAAIEWEALDAPLVIRRTKARAQRRHRLVVPLRVAVIGADEALVDSVAPRVIDTVASGLPPHSLEASQHAVGHLDELSTVLQSSYDIVHLVANCSPDAPDMLRFRDQTVSVADVMKAIPIGNPRLVFVQTAGTAQPTAAIAGLRVASQASHSAGPNYILHAGPIDDPSSVALVENVYGQAIKADFKLAKTPSFSRIAPCTSVVIAPERKSLLGLETALEHEQTRNAVVINDFVRLEQQAQFTADKRPGRILRAERIIPTTGGTEPHSMDQLNRWIESAQETSAAEQRLDAALKSTIPKDPAPQDRFPVASFFRCDPESGTRIPIPEDVTVATVEADERLEFDFWIDPIAGGIRSLGERGRFTPPADTIYPLQLRVTLWSDERILSFDRYESSIDVPAVGPSSRATFELIDYPDDARTAFFVFLQHSGELVGAFRVEARFTQKPERDITAQSIEQVFGAHNYFRFVEAPGTSSLVVLFARRAGQTHVFTLTPDGKPWARVGIADEALQESNRDLYREVTKLALAAAAKEHRHEPLEPDNEALAALAERGYVLFSDIFFVASEPGVAEFVKKTLFRLPAGSRVTIATDGETSRFVVPWGLLYLSDEFRQFPYTVRPENFLGLRYDVAVRPSVAPAPPPPMRDETRVGAAWLSRQDTNEVEKEIRKQFPPTGVVLERIRAQDSSLPALETQTFDLIHFYCHGHTRFPNEFQPTEFFNLFASHVQSIDPSLAPSEKTELATFLDKVRDAKDSLMYLDGGFVYRSSLASRVETLLGAPIVLLSMCESAQVTSSGAGFVTFFLSHGARAAVGTEGPTLWTLGRELDRLIMKRLFEGETIGTAFYAAKRDVAARNPLAVIYSLWGNRDARLPNVTTT
jgi:hypothetical protein